MSYFEVIKYNKRLYQLRDAMGVLVTLVIGENKALLLDTAYGIGNLKEEIEKITDKELIVINSHGHMDHACGNFQFDKVFINKCDYDLCLKHNSVERRTSNLKEARLKKLIDDSFASDAYINAGAGKLEFINVGEVIDLGGLHAHIINMAGHTAGSIGILISEMKLLLASDAACPFVWLFLEESLPLHIYIKMLEDTLKLDFEQFTVGHDARLFEKEKMVRYLDVAKKVDLAKSEKVDFGDFGHNAYCFTEGKLYGNGDVGIIFDPNKM